MRAKGGGTRLADGRWRVRVSLTDEYGRKVTKEFVRATLVAAQRARDKYLAEHGREIEADAEPRTLKDLFEIVEEAIWARAGESHCKNMARYAEQWTSALGKVDVGSLTAPILTRVHVAQCEGKSRSYIGKHRLAIRQALQYAVSDLGWIQSNPAENIRLIRSEAKAKEYPPMTRAEYERMRQLAFDIAGPNVRLIIALMGELGLRTCEAVRVRPTDLESNADIWWVVVRHSKTQAGLRRVPCPDWLAREIQDADYEWWERSGIGDPGNHVRVWWRKHSKTRMYDLRGWRSDEWRRMGISDQVRTALLGHTKTSFTQAVYESIEASDVAKAFGLG